MAWSDGTVVLRPSFVAFPGTLARRWIRSAFWNNGYGNDVLLVIPWIESSSHSLDSNQVLVKKMRSQSDLNSCFKSLISSVSSGELGIMDDSLITSHGLLVLSKECSWITNLHLLPNIRCIFSMESQSTHSFKLLSH